MYIHTRLLLKSTTLEACGRTLAGESGKYLSGKEISEMAMLVSDPVLVFTVVASVILLAPILADRFRIPDIIILLVAGALAGPHGLGFLERDNAIILFGSVGLLYIMFLAGLEIDLHRFFRTRNRSIFFGLTTFCVPQGIGTLLGHYVLSMDWPASILLASMFASHTLLAYPVASRLGISRSEPVAVTVGATIITDTLALLVLAVIADSTRGMDLGFNFWAGIIGGMMLLVSLAVWGIPWLTRLFFLHVPEKGGAQFLFVIAVMCGFSYLSHYAKMEPIIGAFLAGAAFNRLIPEQSTLMNRVQFMGNTLFIPIFLISVGMLVDVRTFVTSPHGWLVGTTMIFGVIGTKYAASLIAQVCFGYKPQDRNVMFGLSVVQAAATLAAVLVGYDLKIFDEAVLNGAIAMIVVTCPLGSWMVDRYGRKIAATSPSPVLRSRVEQKYLVSVANFESSTRLLDMAFLLRNPSVPGAIYPVTIVRDTAETADAVAGGEKLLAHCLAHAASAEMPVIPSVHIGANVSDGIIRAAKELQANAVIMGWSGERSAVGRVFGTVLDNLLDECKSQIFCCRLVRPVNTTRRLLLPLHPLAFRRSDLSVIVNGTKWLAKQIGADLHVYLISGDYDEELRARFLDARPHLPVVFTQTKDWQDTRFRLMSDAKPFDMAILPVERRSNALWSPSLDRLPEAMASRFQYMNLLAAYPAIKSDEDDMIIENATGDIEFIPAGDSVEAIDIESALWKMTGENHLWTDERRNEIFSMFCDAARSFPVQMTPGTVLLHAHSDAVDLPILLVATANEPWTLDGCETRVNVILALVSPAGNSPELHLKTLADITKCLSNVGKIADVRSSKTIVAMLREGVMAIRAPQQG